MGSWNVQKPVTFCTDDFHLDSDSIIATMKYLEQCFWNFLDTNKISEQAYNFRRFLKTVFLSKNLNTHIAHINTYFKQYNKHKRSIPTSGAYIYSIKNSGDSTPKITTDMISVVLVRLSQSPDVLSIPKGKRENDETVIETAIREVCEETGIDISSNINKDTTSFITKKSVLYLIKKDVALNNYKTMEVTEVVQVCVDDITKNPSKYSKQVKLSTKFVIPLILN